MADCLFCKIIKKEIPSEVVYEDDFALAVLDVNPRALGHTMVLPKTHSENIIDLPVEQIGSLFEAVQKVVLLLNKTFFPDGFTIGLNQGRAAGQVIDHLHIHIIPRWLNDGGSSLHSVVNNPPKENLAETAKQIREKNK